MQGTQAGLLDFFAPLPGVSPVASSSAVVAVPPEVPLNTPVQTIAVTSTAVMVPSVATSSVVPLPQPASMDAASTVNTATSDVWPLATLGAIQPQPLITSTVSDLSVIPTATIQPIVAPSEPSLIATATTSLISTPSAMPTLVPASTPVVAEEHVGPLNEPVVSPDDVPYGQIAEIPVQIVEHAVPVHHPIEVIDDESQEEAIEDYHRRVTQQESSRLARASYLGSYLEPWKSGPDEKIELLFENAEITAFISYIEQKFGITFILDDAIKPMPQGGKSLVGQKLSFKTNVPLTKRQVWDVFVMFLDMAGVAPVPGPTERVYRLVASKNPQAVNDATHGPLPILSGVSDTLVPDNDILIRYVYFVVSANPDTIIKAVDVLRSVASPPVIRIPEVNALIITDRAINIKTMLKVIQELDQVDGHEGLAVIRLNRADAVQAAQLYADFSRQDSQQTMARLLGARKSSTTEYFERGARVIPEPRTNSLIVLGSRTAIEVITQFVKNVVERVDERPGLPHYIYKLKFQSAEALAALLQESVKFNAESGSSAHFGGVRDGNKYLNPISIVPEASTNSLIISADYDDYMHLYELIKSLDIEQPQVAIRMFVLNISLEENKGFGAQLRNKIPGVNGLLGNNVNFQTSGLTEVGSGSGIVEDPNNGGMVRLLGNLVSVAASAAIGSTIVQLGSDAFGVWGLLNMLEKYSKVNVVENPFFVTTNKYPAHLVVGETRRVVDANIFTAVSQSAFKDLSATLDIEITPQISSEGFVTLKILFGLSQFTDPNVDSNNGNRTERKLETSVLLSNNQVLALGGLLREEINETESRVPVLGSIPFIGWLFKNRTRVFTNTSILILIQTEILYPIKNNPAAARITQDQFVDSRSLINELNSYSGPRDPINRLFFHDREDRMGRFVNQFSSKGNVYTLEAVEEREAQKNNPIPEKPCRDPYRRRRQKRKLQQEEADRAQQLQPVKSTEPVRGLAIPKPKDSLAKKAEDITAFLNEKSMAEEEDIS